VTTPFATVVREMPTPGLTALRVGDVLEVNGGLAVVDYVNDCRARVRPVLGTTVKVSTRFGQQAEFERASGSVNVARNVERDTILERLGEAGLEQLLASRTAQRSEAEVGGPATENKTSERIIEMANKLRALKGEKKARKPRGGLAADMASGVAEAAEPKPRRARKAKADGEGVSKAPRGARADFIRSLIAENKTGDEIWTATREKFTYSDRKTVDGLVEKIKAVA
jgi:hypothetical protein